jgi:ELWxxDGT repeat protein
VDAAMTDLNGSLLFMGRDEASGFGLWKTDRTTAEFLHPFAIEDAYSGSGMVAWNGQVYFRASDARGDAELWATNGTPAGTVRVKDINDAPYAYYGSYPDELTVFGGALYFRAQGPNYQPTEVWRTDGTEAGTVRVTGLTAPDVFSFGNLVGETGDGAGVTGWRVSALDLGAVKRALNASGPVTSTTDVNRDGRTNALDLGILKRNLNRVLPPPGPAPAFAAPSVALPVPMPDAPTPNPTRRIADDLLL